MVHSNPSFSKTRVPKINSSSEAQHRYRRAWQGVVQPAPPKAQSITEMMFYEEFAKKNPAMPQAICAFLTPPSAG